MLFYSILTGKKKRFMFLILLKNCIFRCSLNFSKCHKGIIEQGPYYKQSEILFLSKCNLIVKLKASVSFCIWTFGHFTALALCMGGTPKRVLLQTVKTQMKCRIMRHFIRVNTVCYGKNDLQTKIQYFLRYNLIPLDMHN